LEYVSDTLYMSFSHFLKCDCSSKLQLLHDIEETTTPIPC